MNITVIMLAHEHVLQERRVLRISFLSYLLIVLTALSYDGGEELDSWASSYS